MKNKFSNIELVFDSLRSNDTKIVLCDFNTKVEKNAIYRGTIRGFSPYNLNLVTRMAIESDNSPEMLASQRNPQEKVGCLDGEPSASTILDVPSYYAN